MISITVRRILCGTLIASALAACGGSGNMSNSLQAQSVQTPLVLSDASSEDWALIGVKVLSIALIPHGGGNAVTVYSAPTPAAMLNLVQLDQLGELLGNVAVPVGTYSGAVLTIAANSGDVALTAAADPGVGFAAAPGASIAANLIQIQGVQGSAPNLTVPVRVKFDSPLMVNASQSNALDLEFDLGHPAFIVGHTPPGAGATLWAVNFNAPVRRHPVADLTQLVLRHLYGTVSSVAADNAAITVTKDLPALPIVNPELPVATSQSVQILADVTNGTLFYDLDAKTVTTIKSFASESSALAGKYVRIASRYQEDGTLVAVRIWASSQFNSVFVGPEGHVLHVDAVNSVMTVANEAGEGVRVAVDADTQFFYRAPGNITADATPIGSGPAFLSNHELVRGFKVHVSVVDPLATPLVAQSVDIETAVYDGKISAANSSGFTYTRHFRTSGDDYSVPLSYISSMTANGKDANGDPVMGFKWWDFAYPTLATSGASAVADFVAVTNGGVSFGGAAAGVSAWGASYAKWNDPANPNGWSVPVTVIVPTPLPLGAVAAGFAGTTFTMNVPGGTNAATVDVSTTAGSATLVYQLDKSNGVLTVSAVDITTSAGITAITNGLTMGAPVKVYGVPQADGTLKAYVLLYYTGDMPGM